MRTSTVLILVVMLGLVAFAGAGCSLLPSGGAPATPTRPAAPPPTVTPGAVLPAATAPAAGTPLGTAPAALATSSASTSVAPPTLGGARTVTSTLGTAQGTPTLAATSAAGQRTATSAPTAGAAQRTPTVAATSAAGQRTATSAPTAGAALATAPSGTPTSGAAGTCTYHATFMGDITVPDYTMVPAGGSFVKTWRVRNDGTCSWGTAGFALHRLAFVSGDQLGAPAFVELPVAEVKPGATVDISVNMVAPSSAGTFKSNWIFQIDNDGTLGVGSTGEVPLYALIIVSGGTPGATPPPSVTPGPSETIPPGGGNG